METWRVRSPSCRGAEVIAICAVGHLADNCPVTGARVGASDGCAGEARIARAWCIASRNWRMGWTIRQPAHRGLRHYGLTCCHSFPCRFSDQRISKAVPVASPASSIARKRRSNFRLACRRRGSPETSVFYLIGMPRQIGANKQHDRPSSSSRGLVVGTGPRATHTSHTQFFDFSCYFSSTGWPRPIETGPVPHLGLQFGGALHSGSPRATPRGGVVLVAGSATFFALDLLPVVRSPPVHRAPVAQRTHAGGGDPVCR